MPVAPRRSLREPTRYHTCSDTIGLRWSSSSRTRRPLSSVVATTASLAAFACAQSPARARWATTRITARIAART